MPVFPVEGISSSEDTTPLQIDDRLKMGHSIPSPEQQKERMQELEKNRPEFVEGSTWYILEVHWYQNWLNHVDELEDEAVPLPGPVDNDALLEDATHCRDNLKEHQDYVILAPKEWEQLVAWYGGGPPISRRAVKTGEDVTLEIRPYPLKFVRSSDQTVVQKMRVSKATTVKELKEKICEKMGILPEDARLWDYHNRIRVRLWDNEDDQLASLDVYSDQHILVEEKDQNGEFTKRKPLSPPRYPNSSYGSSYGPSYSSSYSSSYYNSYSGYSSGYSSYHDPEPTTPGTSGLSNLGNTCFMNSTLQSISHSTPLTKYFLSWKYLSDLNRVNPLGQKGDFAEEYASLLRELFSGQSKSIAPREFKRKLERFAPQFSGYQQHDSQEMLAFLLDGLHEDLNRVKDKPYTESKEHNNRPDAEVAKEAWDLHLVRNDSVIVDWFQGQLKSTLVCPDCEKISITFDPFMYLSLPLPVTMTRKVDVTVLPASLENQIVKYRVEVSKYGQIRELKGKLSELCGINEELIEVAEVWNSTFCKYYGDRGKIDDIRERDEIWAFEMETAPFLSKFSADRDDDGEEEREERKSDDDESEVPDDDDEREMRSTTFSFPERSNIGPETKPTPSRFVSIRMYNAQELTSSYYYSSSKRRELFGLPQILLVDRNVTYQELYQICLHRVSRFLRKIPLPSEKGNKTELDSSIDDTTTEGTYSLNDTATEDPSSLGGSMEASITVEEMDVQPDTFAEEIESKTDEAGNEHESDTDEAGQQPSDWECEGPLFDLHHTDTGGKYTAAFDIVDDGKPLNLENGWSITLDWDEAQHRRWYDEDLEGEHEVDKSAEMKEDESREHEISLEECIELFIKKEKLGPDDPWYCNKCKEFRQASKKFDLWKLPDVLVIHLKRFSYKNRWYREKLNVFVNYPVHGLDLSQFQLDTTAAPPVYDLYAVSDHFGSLGGGHYTAHAKNGDKWYNYDDRCVTEVDEKQVVSSSAYVLFYRRRQLDDDDWSEIPQLMPRPQQPAESDEEGDMGRDSGESDSGHEAPSTNGTRASQGADEEEEAVKEQGEHGAAGVTLSKEEEGQSNDTANTHTETNGVSRSDFSDHMDVDA